MNAQDLVEKLTEAFPGTLVMEGNGDWFLVYDPDSDLPDNRKMPYLTVVTGDRYDDVSDLDRPGAFRLNVGLTKATYQASFGEVAAPDYKAETRFVPHPVYAGQHWVCVVNPSEETVRENWPLVQESYEFAVRKHRNRSAG